MKEKILILILALSIIIIATFNLSSALTISNVQTSPGSIQPGQTFILSFDVENNVQEDIDDVSVSLLLNGYNLQNYAAVPFSPYQSSNTQTFDEIREDKSKNAEFELIANSDADSGTYKIPVQIEYEIGSNKTTEIGVISVIVNAKPILSANSESSGIIKGQKNDLTIKIVNSGLGDAKFLNVKIKAINGASIIGADSFYIGNINKDDFDTIQLSLSVNQNSPSIISIPLEITYKDSSTKEYTETKDVAVKAYTRDEAINLGLIQKSNTAVYVSIIIFLIIAYIIYRIIRRYLKKRKNNQEI